MSSKRVMAKSKSKFDFDFLLKIFFTLLAIAILVLVVLKIVERVNNSKVKKVEPLFSLTDYKDSYIKNLYEGGLDDFFADEQLEIPGYNTTYPGAVFIFVYNSNTDVYIDETLEDEEDQNELKNFLTEDFNKQLLGVQSYYQLATDYINKLNDDERKIVLLLDVYGFEQYYGKSIPEIGYTISETSLAVCQVSYNTNDEKPIDKTQTFTFGKDNYASNYQNLNGILGEVVSTYPKA